MKFKKILFAVALIAAAFPIKAAAAEKWTAYNGGEKCTITAYCLCEKCCGKDWEKNHTASGTPPEEFLTVANGTLPFGTKIYIEGVGYREVQDTGAKVGKKHFDVYVGEQKHESAEEFGVKQCKVWVVE